MYRLQGLFFVVYGKNFSISMIYHSVLYIKVLEYIKCLHAMCISNIVGYILQYTQFFILLLHITFFVDLCNNQ